MNWTFRSFGEGGEPTDASATEFAKSGVIFGVSVYASVFGNVA